jgi:hypothetical protein
VELRGEFMCSWCEMRDGYLSAVPHPKSKCQVRRFACPREADIVGRVIGVTMRPVEAELEEDIPGLDWGNLIWFRLEKQAQANILFVRPR